MLVGAREEGKICLRNCYWWARFQWKLYTCFAHFLWLDIRTHLFSLDGCVSWWNLPLTLRFELVGRPTALLGKLLYNLTLRCVVERLFTYMANADLDALSERLTVEEVRRGLIEELLEAQSLTEKSGLDPRVSGGKVVLQASDVPEPDYYAYDNLGREWEGNQEIFLSVGIPAVRSVASEQETWPEGGIAACCRLREIGRGSAKQNAIAIRRWSASWSANGDWPVHPDDAEQCPDDDVERF